MKEYAYNTPRELTKGVLGLEKMFCSNRSRSAVPGIWNPCGKLSSTDNTYMCGSTIADSGRTADLEIKDTGYTTSSNKTAISDIISGGNKYENSTSETTENT